MKQKVLPLKSMLLILLSLGILHNSAIAQQLKRCANEQYIQFQRSQNPNYDLERRQANLLIEQKLDELSRNPDDNTVYRIPVVVHVVWRTTTEKITEDQVKSQIDVLNEDYRRLNADASSTPSAFASAAGDVKVEFCLATVDPSGNATTGVVYKQTTTNSFTTNDFVKTAATGGSNPWPNTKYLNIWVCNLGSGLLGYATFPQGTQPNAKDGVVIGYKYFGRFGSAQTPFNLGRTATHEVGHWLNLYHIWGDDSDGYPSTAECSGSDLVSDTPNQSDENYNCPGYPLTDGCTATGSGVMFMNYMDYVNDGCMNMFTNGQIARMRATLAGFRSTIVGNATAACGNGPVVSCIFDSNATPYPMGFETNEDLTKWSTENTNNDSYNSNAVSWGIFDAYAQEYGPRTGTYFVGYSYNPDQTTAANDWLFTPCINFQAGHSYRLTFWDAAAKSAGITYPERLKVHITSDNVSTATVTTLLDLNNITNTFPTYLKQTVLYNPTTNIDGHFAFQCYSIANQYVLMIDDILIEDLGTSATQDAELNNNVSIVPNPANGFLHINAQLPSATDNVTIQLLDVVGRVIDTQSFNHVGTLNTRMELDNVPNGMYFVHIAAGNKFITRKVMVQH